MNKHQALNHYLSNYEQIYTEIIVAILNITEKTNKKFNINDIKEREKLKKFISKIT